MNKPNLTELIFNVRVARKNYFDAYHRGSSKEHLQQLRSEIDHAERIITDFCVDHEQELAEWERGYLRSSTAWHTKDDR